MVRRYKSAAGGQDNLFSFSAGPRPQVTVQLAAMHWPPSQQFLVNHLGRHVRDLVWGDLLQSGQALVVAGFASISTIVELVAARSIKADTGTIRVVLGNEPFRTDRVYFGSAMAAFNAEVRQYWEQEGVSLRLSAKIVQTLTALEQGWFQIRVVPGTTMLHAKIYVGDDAATLGSSNFTDPGLSAQFEANARFERVKEPDRYAQTKLGAQNFWDAGADWSEQLRELLNELLQVVPWQEALGRACADLLEGQWAERYLGTVASRSALWPSQLAGIAQAMWVVENVGSVLIADATGSGKTRMGAHLTRAVRDRLWNTGRLRSDLTVLTCPPPVQHHWRREALACGLTLQIVSHGQLSRSVTEVSGLQAEEVGKAQILAVDEAHNFLSKMSLRTRRVRETTADHVLLFTATPINRGAEDLLSLIDLLDADNLEDETLELLDQLGRRRHGVALTAGQQELLRREIQRFTVRRTKSVLNEMVDQDPDAYRDPVSGRVFRYPRHESQLYRTGETTADEELALEVRGYAQSLKGLSLLGEKWTVPATLRREYTDQRWLDMRLGVCAGLAAHYVQTSMRSSTAALLEHLIGTQAAVAALSITGLMKTQSTGNTIAIVQALRETGPPQVELTCAIPSWLTDGVHWRQACDRELELLESIHRAALQLSDARERTKAAHLLTLSKTHPRILAFDHHPISLAAISGFLAAGDVEVIIAIGSATKERKQVRARFAIDSQQAGIALCTDAMSEGLNLQGASAIVQLDMPTTLRVAEQRVGRVDRMDSPYEVIQVSWPADGTAFATRANEVLTDRSEASAALLGSNLSIPDLTGGTGTTIAGIRREDIPVDVQAFADSVDAGAAETWDGIRDALDPVRQLVSGRDALLTSDEYASHRTAGPRVLARISPVHSSQPWAFFAVRGHRNGAPRWICLIGTGPAIVHGLDRICAELHDRLAEHPESRAFDEDCDRWLRHFLDAAAKAERQLIPRRMQRALQQMHETCRAWAQLARTDGDQDLGERWEAIASIARPGEEDLLVDPYQLGERWLQLVQPVREQARTGRQRSRYARISDINPQLRATPFHISDVEGHLSDLHQLEPFDQRVSAGILGVPQQNSADDGEPLRPN